MDGCLLEAHKVLWRIQHGPAVLAAIPGGCPLLGRTDLSRSSRLPWIAFLIGAALMAALQLSPIARANCLVESCAAGIWLVLAPITLMPLGIGIVVGREAMSNQFGRVGLACSLPGFFAFAIQAPGSGPDHRLIVFLTGVVLLAVGLVASWLLLHVGSLIRTRIGAVGRPDGNSITTEPGSDPGRPTRPQSS
jgi:hypothetical protein